MDFDFNTLVIGRNTGYGNASRQLVRALGERGSYNVPCSPIALNFSMPTDYKYSDYTIGYTPWESTEVPYNWMTGLLEVDDLWSTSAWTAKQLARIADREVFVLPHGIEPCWKPVLHEVSNKPFTFIHVGDPAIRKGGDIVLQAWYKHFRFRTDLRLIYKCIKYPLARVKDKTGSIIVAPGSIDNVVVITKSLSQNEMWNLYRDSDCLVYPTRGEGFGLIPFEAMASGLPTILPVQGGTGQFAGLSDLQITRSIWVNSNNDDIHPGLWMDHDLDEVVFLMEKAMDDRYDHYGAAYESAFDLHSTYSWEQIADNALTRMSLYSPT
jgi:glycosyltransferase involved in cell wall biosynthesis